MTGMTLCWIREIGTGMYSDRATVLRKMLWFVVAFVGLVFVLQAADLWALQVLSANGATKPSLETGSDPLPEAGAPQPAQLTGVGSSTYLPIVDPLETQEHVSIAVAADAPDAVPNFALVGDGGDLGRRARQIVGRFAPLMFAVRVKDEVHIDLAKMAERVDGELRWSPSDQEAVMITADSVVRLRTDSTQAEVNLTPTTLSAAPQITGDRLTIPVSALGSLFDAEVKWSEQSHVYTVATGPATVTVVALEDVFALRVSRSQRRLQVYVLGEPVKSYPMCVGAGNNTPVGHFHIQNRAVWPPWNSYWGEYIPGGSSRNPLGARWLGTTARGSSRGWAIGMHGTNQPNSIGQRISGGCLRLHNADAIELFNNIPIGTRVWIHEAPIAHD
jgi:lipoprotein-anchoring transpeptidase ErfK/SrfK